MALADDAGQAVSSGTGLARSGLSLAMKFGAVAGLATVAALAFGDVSYAMSADTVSSVGTEVASASATGAEVDVPIGGSEALNFASNVVGQWLEWGQDGLAWLNDLVNG